MSGETFASPLKRAQGDSEMPSTSNNPGRPRFASASPVKVDVATEQRRRPVPSAAMADSPEIKVPEALVTITVPCRACGGTGTQTLPRGQQRPGGGLPDCPHCDGTGGRDRKFGMDMLAEFLKGPLGLP
jgi:hypothetical protein